MQNCESMEGNLNECTTGILIDLEDKENMTEDKSNNECTTGILIDLEDKGNMTEDKSNIGEFHLYEHTKDAEKQSVISCEKSKCIMDRFDNIHLEDNMDIKKEMLSIPRGGWKTPSPKSMKIISKEASKIIDLLHTSPIGSTEVLLVDEEFPVPFSFHNYCSGEFLAESLKISRNNEDATEDNISEVHVSQINADMPSTLTLEPEISELTDMQADDSFHGKFTVGTKQSKPISMQMKNKDGNAFQIPMKSIKRNEENASEEKSPTDADLPSAIIMYPEISVAVDLQTENLVKDSAVLSKCSKPISIEAKSKKFYGNILKTPLETIKVNKENASERKSNINAVIHLEYEISKAADIQTNSIQNSIVKASKHSKPILKQTVSKNMYGNRIKTPIKSRMNIENASEQKAGIDADVPLNVLDSEISELAGMQTEDFPPKNIAALNNVAKPISIPMKFNNMYGNAFKTPIKSSKTNNENVYERKAVPSGIKVPRSDTNISNKCVLGDTNAKGIGMLKFVPKVENSSKEKHADIPEKIKSIASRSIVCNSVGSNKRDSITLPRTSNAMQYQSGSREKQALYKTSSLVETPSYPKCVRRSNSFQSRNQKYSIPNRLLKTCSEQEYRSAEDSVKKTVTNKTELSVKPLKSRMSMGPILSTGNGASTPLRRSNSLSKNSGTSSSISRPSTSCKISPVSENNPQPSLLKRPVFSTSSRNRFCSRLTLPSTLPPSMNDNLPRKLFPDLKMPMKR